MKNIAKKIQFWGLILILSIFTNQISAQKAIEILVLEESPVIDGDFDDWENSSLRSIDVEGSGLENISDSADFTPQWAINADAENLYIYVKVLDDILVSGNPQAWHNDNLEIAIDGNGDRDYDLTWQPQFSDFKLVVKYGATMDDVISNSSNFDIRDLSNFEYAQTDIEGGYAFELKIPFEIITDDFEDINNTSIVMELNAGDNDEGDEGRRETQLRWSGNTNMNKDASDFGLIVFYEIPESPKSVELEIGGDTILVDGDFSDWTDINLRDFEINGGGISNITGSADFTPRWALSADEENLFIHVTVLDDSLVSGNPQAWHNDNIEIAIDGNGDRNYNLNWNPQFSDFKLIVKHGATLDDVVANSQNFDIRDLSNFEYAQSDIEGGYAFELKIPFQAISENFDDPAFPRITIELNAGDNDAGNDGRRETQLRWSGLSNMNQDASGFGLIAFYRTPEDVASLDVHYLESELEIDGSSDDWELFNKNYPAVRSGGILKIDNTADFDPSFKAAWNYDGLYLLVEVRDDSIVSTVPQAWHNDNVEISIDGNADRDFNLTWEPQPTDFKVIVKANATLEDVKSSGNNLDSRDLSELEYAPVTVDEGWGFELKFPWTAFGDDFEISNLDTVVIELNFGDNDAGPSGRRETQIRWSGNTNMNQDASGFGNFILKENVTSVIDLNNPDFEVYPNPVRNNLHISNTNEIDKITIYSITGSSVKEFNINQSGNITLDVAELSQGIYILRVLETSGKAISNKFIKN